MNQFRIKSIKINMILNGIKGIMGVIFPLITFPYVSKVLGVENIGKYNFSNSIISYFILLAGLGISSYAIREGAKLRDKKIDFDLFVNEMFSINIISTLVAYIIFIITITYVSKFNGYIVLLSILSLQILFKTIGVEWIYSIYEDYLYITIRSIVVQILSIVLLFIFVKNKDDLECYVLITVISSCGANLFNYIHAKKYCKIRFTSSIRWKKHLKPILILWGMVITVSVYVNSDITMLGFLCDDYTVGIYSVSSKVYTIVKTLLSSILVVSIPRLSFLSQKNESEDFGMVATDIYKTLLTVLIPTIVGIILLSKYIVVLISNYEYIEASSSLNLLSIALMFCLGAWFWGQCILIPQKKENIVLGITVISALTNVVLNFFLIPVWGENAAALTTVISEGLSFGLCWHKGKRFANISKMKDTIIKIALGCIGIILVANLNKILFASNYLYVTATIICSILTYGAIEVILKNDVLNDVLKRGNLWNK